MVCIGVFSGDTSYSTLQLLTTSVCPGGHPSLWAAWKLEPVLPLLIRCKVSNGAPFHLRRSHLSSELLELRPQKTALFFFLRYLLFVSQKFSSCTF